MRRLAVLVTVALVFCAAAVPMAEPASAGDDGAEQAFVELVNVERASKGLRALAVRDDVVPVARNWTARMLGDGVLSHNPSLSAQMPSDWSRIGENVGYGTSVEALHAAFMASAGHRANVLGDYNQLGVGADRDGSGRLWVTLDFMKGDGRAPAPIPVPRSAAALGDQGSATGATGYYVLGSDGGVFGYGNAPHMGSVPDLGLRISAVLMTPTPRYGGYWIAGSDGGIFSFGDAQFHGSVPGLELGSPVTAVDLEPTPTGGGYWVLGSDGGIFSFGDAEFFGSLPGIGVRTRAVRLVATSSGRGYWILGADGGIFSFGDAEFFGSVPGLGLRATGVSMARSSTGRGYWVLGSDGGIFSFGDAGFFGSVPGLGLGERVDGVELSRTVAGDGYYIVSDHGRVFAFGDAPFLGEPAGNGAVTRDIAAVSR